MRVGVRFGTLSESLKVWAGEPERQANPIYSGVNGDQKKKKAKQEYAAVLKK